MSHIANDIVADNKMDNNPYLFTAYDADTKEDTTEYWKEQEVEAQERAEWRYDNAQEPTCGEGRSYYDN